MADVNAKIGVSIDASAALAELKSLQRQLSAFHSSLSKGSAASVAAQKNLSTNLLNSINATGKFTAQMGLVRSSTESFTHSLEKNKLSMREYFRYAGGSTRTFGKLFKQEFNTIGKVAEERVKKMQTQYIKMGRDASGAIKAMSITPRTLDMNDYATKTALAAQKQALLNQLLKQGSTNLLNFGKNTQWAGRQLMVGFTIPLAYFGSAAAKTFMDLEAQAIKFKRVYGDIFTTADETNKALKDIQLLAESFTKYGVSVAKTMEMAAQAAAMGKTGADLTAQVAEATRLAVLGGVEQTQALETTISVTNAFGVAADDLKNKINFLNAVENQTVVSIEDLTEAIPKAGPVIKQLGGSVEDLAFFLTAMKEGGINASEGANALKSGLASLINPSDKAAAFLGKLGVNIKAIVEGNQGNIKETVVDFAQALDTLDPLNRARAIEQLFGKFQFSRLSTLFQNVTKEGTQASKVLQLASASIEELAILAERELGTVENAIGVDFKESVEKLKLAIAPIGKTFLEAVTPIVKILGRLLDKFDSLGEGTKKFIVVASTLVGVIGPVLLMTFGLLANGIANIVKLFVTMRVGFLKAGSNTKILADQTSYLNSEQLEAATVATSLNQAHNRLTQSFTAEALAVKALRQTYLDATIAATNFARANPGMMGPGAIKGGKIPKRFASGTTGVVGGTPGKDSVPSLLMPGEAVVPTGIAQDNKYKPLVEALVTGKIKKYGKGTVSAGDDYTHIGGGRLTNLDDIIAQGRLTENEKTQAQMYRDILKATGKSPEARAYGSLALSFDPKLNKGLATKNGVSLSDFEREWASRPNKWSPSGLTSAQTQAIDSAMMDQIRRSPRVTDSVIENAFKNVPDNIKSTPAYQKMLSQYERIGGYSLGKGLGSTPQTSAQILEQAKRAGIIKDFRVETRQRQSGSTATKSLTVTTNDGREISLGRGSKANRIYFSDKSLAQKQQSTVSPVARKTGSTIIEDIRRYQQARYNREDNALLEAMRGGTKSGVVNSQTGIARPSALNVLGGGPNDTRQIAVGKGEAILTKKTTSSLRAGKGVFVPGMGRLGIIGADKGIPGGQTQGGSLEIPFSGSRPASAKLKEYEKNMKISAKELKSKIDIQKEENKITKQSLDDKKQQDKLAKAETKNQRSMKIGRIAGPVAGVAGMGAMAGYMTGNAGIGNAMMGVSALATVAQMISGPIGIAVAAATTLAGGFLLLNKRMDDATKKQVAYVNSVTAGSKQMQKIGELTGNVGASQIAQKQRETGSRVNEFRTGYDRGGNQFGTNFLASDIGKEIFKGFNDTVAKDGDKAAKLLATQLGAYISDGVMSAEQANSVARAIGINLGDMSISTNINGELRKLVGPDGQDILTNPLKVRLNIISSQAEMSDDLKDKINNFSGDGFQYVGYVAQAATANAKNLEIIQAQRDAQWQTNQATIDSLQKQKIATTDKEKQLQLENKIIAAKTKQKLEDQILAEKSKQIIKDAEDLYNLARNNATGSASRASGAYVDALQAGIKQAQKDNPFLNEFIEKGAALKSVQLEAQIDTAVLGGQLSIPTALKLMEMFAGVEGGEAKLKGILETTVVSQNPGVVQAFFDIVSGKKIKSKITTEILDPANGGSFEDRVNVLNKLKDFDGDSINLTTFINEKGTKGIDELAKDFKAIENIKSPVTLETISKVTELSSDPNLNISGLSLIWDKYENATDEIKKTVIQEYIAIFKSLGPEEAKNFIQSEIAKGYGFGDNSDRKVAAIKSKYQNPDGTANLPAIAAEMVSQKAALAPNKIPNGKSDSEESGQRNTDFDSVLTGLKRTRDSRINAQGGAPELMRILGKNKDIKIFNGLDQQLGKAGANTDFIDWIGGLEKAIQNKLIKVAKDGTVSVTELGNAAKKAFDAKQLGSFAAQQFNAIEGAKAQRTAFVKLTAAGMDQAQALELVADANLAVAISRETDAKKIKELIKLYNDASVAVKGTARANDPIRAFRDDMDKVNEMLDVQERQAKAKYQPEIDRINDLIDANEKAIDAKQRYSEITYDRPIQQRQSEITELNHDLSLIEKTASTITEKYNKQREALEQVYSINSRIADQQKAKISLADALTSGDISQAAQILQDIRSQEQTYAKEESLNALEIAQTKEINALRSAGGLSKLQIEEKIYTLGEEIYVLEQKQAIVAKEILALQDANYNFKVGQLAAAEKLLDNEIKLIEKQRLKYAEAELAIKSAEVGTNDYTEALKRAEEVLKRMAILWASMGSKTSASLKTTSDIIGGGTNSNYDDIDGVNSTYIDPKTGHEMLDLKDPDNAASARLQAQADAYFKAHPEIDPLTGASRFATGGMVAGSGMTDSVRAMLTPGEFVMNRAATQKYGPLLERINESKYPGNLSLGGTPMVNMVSNSSANSSNTSVYNYSLSVGVNGTSASPDDIARTVIAQIRNMDAQRLRGNRY